MTTQIEDRVADELARAVERRLATTVRLDDLDVGFRRNVDLSGVGAPAERHDRRMLEEHDRVGDRALRHRRGQRSLETPGFPVRNEAKVEKVRPAAHPLTLATTCKAASDMKVTLMIADFARVANGKLDVIGGGWSMMNAQGPFGFFVAALFQIPWDQTNAKHTFKLELLDADGQGVPIPSGETVRAEGEFEVGRPAGLRPGTPVDAPLVVPFGPLELEEGRYELRLTIDDETKEDWFVAFTVRHAAAQAG
jgi:hypothetical protein